MAFKLTKANVRPVEATMKLVHPVGGETDATITLVGTLSKQFKEAQAAMFEQLGPDADVTALPVKEQAKLFSNVYAACITGWNEELAEAVGHYSPETALSLFNDPDIDWIGGQVALFISRTAHFFRDTTA